ncbi:LamG domain-containing protein [Pseudochryseolinea flava]|uniref:LamG-like jellyroll fold domain-containing protein n=1 Tax=Pseudochryseolinea flava TaxID=2059302 RepID=A0A364Y1B2_9BACT|nr:LamG domain-containing protein [Pseudochryseolinea flava]RAW00613.1 hypothetical protein DQQ10_13550 [Pseudochryseolinea flava]
MKRKPFSVKLLFAVALVSVMASCDEDDLRKSTVNFEVAETTVLENGNDVLVIKLDVPQPKDQFVTIQISESEGEYGSDYIVANAVAPTESIMITVPKNSTTVSIPVYAFSDAINESDERVVLTIVSGSDEIVVGKDKTSTIIIENVNTPPTAPTNRAISFDGVDDFIDLKNIYDDVTLPITISSWVKLAETSSLKSPIFDSQDGKTAYSGFHMFIGYMSHVSCEYGDGKGGNSSVFRRSATHIYEADFTDRWLNMTTVMRSKTDMSVYLNGIEMSVILTGESDAPMNSNSPTENAVIGVHHGNEGDVYYFKGLMDEVKVWNKALTLQEIQTKIFTKSIVGETGLIGYWDFDEAEGTDILDKSPNQFHGVIKNNATRVISQAPVN